MKYLLLMNGDLLTLKVTKGAYETPLVTFTFYKVLTVDKQVLVG